MVDNTAATTPLPLTVFTNWLAFGERGLSSEAIVSHLTGQRLGGRFHDRCVHYPHDPDDFRRCQLLLEAVPLAGLLFPAMQTASPEWARLVAAWDEIHELIEREAPGYLHKREGSAPLAYRLMRRTIAGGTCCSVCAGSGRGKACEKCKGTARRSGGRCRAQRCYSGYDVCRACCGYGYIGGAA